MGEKGQDLSLIDRPRESIGAVAFVFRHPNLRRFELSSSAHVASEWMYTVALSVAAYDVGGVALVGLAGFARMAPSAIAAPFASTLADRYETQKTLAVVYLLRGLVLAASGSLLLAARSVVVIIVVAIVTNLVSAVIRPAQWSLPPKISLSPQELTATMAGWSIIEGASIFVGPAVAGLLLSVTPAGAIFLIASGVCVAAAWTASRIVTLVVPTEDVGAASEPPFKAVVAGLRALARNRHPRLIIGLFGVQTFVRGTLNVLIVVAAIQLHGMGKPGVGYLNSAMGVGGLIGGIGAVLLVGRTRLAMPFALGLCLWGLPIVLLGIIPSPLAAVFLIALVGGANALADVSGLTLLQRIAPSNVLARIFGVLEGMVFLGVALGSAVTPFVVSAVGPRPAHVIIGAVLPVLVAVMLTSIRKLDEVAKVPVAQLALIRSIDLFRPLQAPAIEHLASRLIPVRFSRDEVIFRQGDPGDRFYVISRGRVEVMRDGSRTAMLGAGDYFGEIALVRDVPRTATIRAEDDVDLHALERDDFVPAVTGHSTSAETAEAVIGSRMVGCSMRAASA